MKALTLHQPWASLIAVGAKTIETRSWSTSHRGALAIHAGKHRPECTQWEEGPFDDIVQGDLGHQFGAREDERRYGTIIPDSWFLTLAPEHRDYIPMPLGAVVASCTLANVVPIVDDGTARNCVDVRVGSWPDNAALRVDDADGQEVIVEVGDQVGLGDFTPGRFAWLLEDVTLLAEPVPAKGRQGLWEWDEAAR